MFGLCCTFFLSTVLQLIRDINRLNEDLSDFISTIYDKKLKPQKKHTNKIAKMLLRLSETHKDGSPMTKVESDARDFLVCIARAMLRRQQSLLRPPRTISTGNKTTDAIEPFQLISLALIQLCARNIRPELSGMEAYVRGEAALAAALVRWLQLVAPNESIFVATPHRIQRHSVREALRSARKDADLTNLFENLRLSEKSNNVKERTVIVDTIERLQGKYIANTETRTQIN